MRTLLPARLCIQPSRVKQPRGHTLIVPLTTEEGWASLLTRPPTWQPSTAPIVLVAPHPDDEILGVGGLIAAQRKRGVEVTVVAVTDGENAYPHQGDNAGLRAQRCAEQTIALERVGVNANKIVRLRLPDSDVTSHLTELVEQLASLVSPATHLIAPWRGDFHPDHEACGHAAEQVARNTGAALTSYFFWTWHRGQPSLLENLPLQRFFLDPQSLQAKSEALQCHRSQLAWPGAEPILPEYLLGPAKRAYEVFLTS